jgi:hypothetical protein
MTEDIRTERRFGVTAELKPIQRRNLLGLRNSDVWDDCLDVMEMCCIEIETDLINTSADDEAAVLANHKMSKAAWKIFTHFQEKVQTEANLYLASVAKQPLVPQLTPREQWIESVLDATAPQPTDDYMGI